MDQEGWNRETTCYPTAACFDEDPVPEISGYHWRYGIDADAGAAFEISAGRIFDRIRLELSLTQRKNNLNQIFRGITDYDGMPMEERSGGRVVSNARASIDHLSVSTLSLNAYYDFPPGLDLAGKHGRKTMIRKKWIDGLVSIIMNVLIDEIRH